tara:strand:- start:63 stop:1094 length:1032 start_codon:yes stop_codon:yes gene_type:complete
MSYLDPKERVIDLQLTSYGKYLLSIGKLNPVYYAFFDDDVLYDGQYASILESQSDIEPRIQEGTPRLSVQTAYSGRDLEIFNKNPNIINNLIIGSDIEDEEKLKQGLIKIADEPEAAEILQQPLGKSNPQYDFAPAWSINFLKQPLSSSTNYLSISSSRGEQFRNIPQLEADVLFEIKKNSANVASSDVSDMGFLSAETEYISQLEFSDGSNIVVDNTSFIALKIEEDNTFFEDENFEVEFFRVLTINGEETLIPLTYFDAGVDDPEELEEELGVHGNTQCVQSYLTVRIDEEIDLDVICPLIGNDQVKNIYQDGIFKCEDKGEDLDTLDIYEDTDDTEDICD